MPQIYFVGVDVGTGSVRSALVNCRGKVIDTHFKEIKTWNPKFNHYEQSSDNIWEAVCESVKAVTKNCRKEEIAAIGFDATCSLVALDVNNNPLTVSTTGNDEQNIILWMDHRASKEAEFINSTKHDILKYVGGKVSVEMEIPKLLWIKNNMLLSCWNRIGKFLDLPDFLTYKCTGSASRSLCSVVCKWNFDGVNLCWPIDYLEKIGLSDLAKENFKIIGNKILSPGDPVGNGLTSKAANDLGLLLGTAVATSIIDAHAGALALFACQGGEGIDNDFTSKMAIICGTSSCHMSVTDNEIFTFGIWGPYKGAIYPSMNLLEAGQSATGILIEHIVKTHSAYHIIEKNSAGKNIFLYLNEFLVKLAITKELSHVHELTKNIHIWPDFHGNRSPIANPHLKGMVSGMSMNTDEENLAITYLACVQSLAYGTKHILDTLIKNGRSDFKSILICGGLSKNQLFVQTHSDICTVPVLLPNETESVLVGAAILAASSAKVFIDLNSASKAMGGTSSVIKPNTKTYDYHNKKYKVFLKMLDDQRTYEKIMNE